MEVCFIFLIVINSEKMSNFFNNEERGRIRKKNEILKKIIKK